MNKKLRKGCFVEQGRSLEFIYVHILDDENMTQTASRNRILYVSRVPSASCWRTCTRNQRQRDQALKLIRPFWHLESPGPPPSN